jgi:hypothetical protein
MMLAVVFLVSLRVLCLKQLVGPRFRLAREGAQVRCQPRDKEYVSSEYVTAQQMIYLFVGDRTMSISFYCPNLGANSRSEKRKTWSQRTVNYMDYLVCCLPPLG